mmetsp:Transcript_652/g.924  ORF Transcript_652/g.924 Transcript_652/m.924 type:complete len:90 (-) Transcript_652:138-407(-)
MLFLPLTTNPDTRGVQKTSFGPLTRGPPGWSPPREAAGSEQQAGGRKGGFVRAGRYFLLLQESDLLVAVTSGDRPNRMRRQLELRTDRT